MNVCYFTLITLIFSLLSLNYLFDIWKKVSKNFIGSVLAPADKAANNVVVVWRLYYINTLIQEFGSTKTYERISTDERSIVNNNSIEITAKFAVSIKEKQDRPPTLYWLPKLHKRPYKARFIANSSSCTTTNLSKLLSSCLTKRHWIRYYDTVYERDGINNFWSITNSNDVLNKFKSKNFQASKLSTYDFSTLYTMLPHHLIKGKLIDLINRKFIRENTQYLACNEECAFFTSDVYNNHNLWSCQKVCDALVYLLDNIFIRFGTKLYRQTVGIPMGTNCPPLVTDLFFFFCYERDFMVSLTWKSGWHYWGFQFNFKIPWWFIKYWQYLLWPNGGPDISYETPIKQSKFFQYRGSFFLDLNLCISNGTVTTKIYDKRDDFDFDVVNFPFPPAYLIWGIHISTY